MRKINLQEQFIMAYGGLRGAVGFSLVMMIDSEIVPPKPMFVTTTLAMVLFTMFIQRWLAHYDHRYLKKWFCKKEYNTDMMTLLEELAITDHLCNLYGPSVVLEKKKEYEEEQYTDNEDDQSSQGTRQSLTLQDVAAQPATQEARLLVVPTFQYMLADQDNNGQLTRQDHGQPPRKMSRVGSSLKVPTLHTMPQDYDTPGQITRQTSSYASSNTPPEEIALSTQSPSSTATSSEEDGSIKLVAPLSVLIGRGARKRKTGMVMVNELDREALKVALRTVKGQCVTYKQLHQRHNPNLIHDSDQEMQSHLRRRHQAALHYGQMAQLSVRPGYPASPNAFSDLETSPLQGKSAEEGKIFSCASREQARASRPSLGSTRSRSAGERRTNRLIWAGNQHRLVHSLPRLSNSDSIDSAKADVGAIQAQQQLRPPCKDQDISELEQQPEQHGQHQRTGEVLAMPGEARYPF
ncbi:unnamed protein product [Sphagnum tenellum]